MKNESSLFGWITASTFLLGLVLLHALGYIYAENMMDVLSEKPSGDLYANDFGFQYLAFWITQGWIFLVLLIIYVPIQGIALRKLFGKYITKA